ncbi:MAG: helix-turn-helix transcriptional regulator [Lachnospiraceae bacterium]|nr:helix-turn-helix transcriptional regulator [Lachnospiraceae bacterium]
MIDPEKIGKKIAFLRKERGYTGESLAEQLHVSPQAVSKWENAHCLPETAILPALARALDCSIDSLLCPRELFILEAVYTDGCTSVPVTHFVNDLVRDNSLNIYVNDPFVGASLESDRLKLLLLKFQTPGGIFFSYALQNENLTLNRESGGVAGEQAFQIIGAYYGNGREYSSVMQKMEHYKYFNWDRIPVNHETFPSNTASHDTEYLTLIYLNGDGIHAVSCPENETLYYENHRTRLGLRGNAKCILRDIPRLSWGTGMECPWAGSLSTALQYMGEPWTYPRIMGMSGACWRTCFTQVWDFSCTDALVAFDYAAPLSRAIGRSFRMADRLEKQERQAERLSIMEDIQRGRPVLAINLRVAPEWGIITGYTDGGERFLCRTYFDREAFDILEQENCPNPEDRRLVFEDNEGYLYSDFWPFLLLHFEEKRQKPAPLESLRNSLSLLTASFHAEENRGYYQGKEAYEAWIKGLSKEDDFQLETDRESVLRRLSVNDNMLCCLGDARQAAASYLRESLPLLPESGQSYLAEIMANCETISRMISGFRDRLSRSPACAISYNTVRAFGVSTPRLREEQIILLKKALELEEENCRLAQKILE